MQLTNSNQPEQAGIVITVNEVDTNKQYPPYSVTTTSTCDGVTGFTDNGYRTRKRQIPLEHIHAISGVDAGGGASYQWYGKHSYDQIFGPLAESRKKNVEHCVIYTKDGEVIIINDDIRDFGMYHWDVTPSFDGEHIDAVFLPEADRKEGDTVYVPQNNALGKIFSLPPGFTNPDVDGRFITALFLPELHRDEHGIIHTVKSKILASEIKSVHLKSQFNPAQLASWPANVLDMIGAVVVLNNGRLIYTTQSSFTSLNWVRPAKSKATQGTLLPALPTMPLPNRDTECTIQPSNQEMSNIEQLRDRLARLRDTENTLK